MLLAIKTRNVIVAFWSVYCRSYWNSCLLLVKLSVVQSFCPSYAVFRLERFTEVEEFTYLGKHFPCANANWYFGKCRKRRKKFDQDKSCNSCNYPVIRHGFNTVGNQGQDDRYIRLWRFNMLHPVVSRSCDCHVYGQAFLSWQITEKSENDWNALISWNFLSTNLPRNLLAKGSQTRTDFAAMPTHV